MRKKPAFTFFDMNPLILFCVIYVVTILINAVILGALSNVAYISIRHLTDNAILCGAPVVTLILFRRVPLLKYFDDDDCSPWISVSVHYVLSCALLLGFGFVLAVIRAVPATLADYLGLIGVYTQGYIVVVIFGVVIEVSKVESVNKNLKIIQESQKRKTGGVQSE
ncbi:MAG: hypothetical protein FWB88_10140 [Defluviitaleaceae bacterium]|nr:hypothetical protein [Defluviitaleaceae bacterium]MCL2239865.1 hypothetical protein [Defluviitaleaceae bacterium]